MNLTRHMQTRAGVGEGKPNDPEDVGRIQLMLRHSGGAPSLRADGVFGAGTLEAIKDFQGKVMKITADGKVDPYSETFRVLQDKASPSIEYSGSLNLLARDLNSLSDADYRAAAATLGCDIAAIKAVAIAESKGNPFLTDGRPKILYEPHVFGAETLHQYDRSFPYVSRRAQIARSKGESYGTNTEQYDKLQIAMVLDREAALISVSWGRFQIVGKYWKLAGASNLKEFTDQISRSERGQLDQFVAFVKSKKLEGALKDHDWAKFARGYNGAGYWRDNYDGKISDIYNKLVPPKAVVKK
jgi:N-acetylmuramidase/Putative peptidoglycan binding domain